jgi:condensin complex subunit 2
LQSQPVAFSQATVLLDAIASGNISTMESTNHYEYFNSQALANLSSGNLWAGAEHWKKMRRKTNGGTGTVTGAGGNSQDDTVTGGKNPAKNRKGRKGKSKALSSISSGRIAVLLNKPIDNLDELLLKKPSPPKKTGRGKADPLQLTKAMKTKYGKNDNLLPMDAGIDVKEFTTLFGHPKTNLMDLAKAKRDAALLASAGTNARSTKVVGFGGVETWGEHGAGDNDSYGDNDDGAGFNFGGGGDDDDDDYGDNVNPNEFVVPELDDVRKVNKIKIGYATIAKKVDVKRLKRDLWTELEQTFAKNAINKNEEEEEAKNQDDDDALSTASTVSDPDPVLAGTSGSDENYNDENSAAKTTTTTTTTETTLSFQDTVRDMQMNESQPDVTLPFYFICILHLCNEKGLALESSGLDDFIIHSS